MRNLKPQVVLGTNITMYYTRYIGDKCYEIENEKRFIGHRRNQKLLKTYSSAIRYGRDDYLFLSKVVFLFIPLITFCIVFA